MSSLSVKSLYKVFGHDAEQAVRRLTEGMHRDEALAGLRASAAVIDASFDVERGEIFVVMGLSGSGKSTLIRMLNGLLAPSYGSVRLDGVELTSLKPAALRALRRDKISMVFQHFALLPHRSVRENAGYALEIAGRPRAEREARALEALRLVGLDGWEDKLPQQLSGGMRQRVGLARALASGTEIMLMDEAFSALDPLIRRELQDQLLQLQSKLGKTVVFITHDLNEAMRLGDRIAVMRAGRIVQIGTAEQILTNPVNDYVAQFVANVDRTRILTASSVMEKPLSVIDVKVDPRVAARTLREARTSAGYVTGRNTRFLGTITDDAVDQAVRDGRHDLVGVVSTENVLSVPADTPVADLFSACAQSPHPVAVIDPDGRLAGVIPRTTLLSALGNRGVDTTRKATNPSETTPRPEPAGGTIASDGVATSGVPGGTARVPAQPNADLTLKGEPA